MLDWKEQLFSLRWETGGGNPIFILWVSPTTIFCIQFILILFHEDLNMVIFLGSNKGNGFLLDWKWVFPIQSNFLSISSSSSFSSSSSRQQSSSLRGKEASFESAKMSTLSLIPEESETRYKDSLKQYLCPDGVLQSIESSYAATQGMKMDIGEKEACVDSHNAFCDINMPVLVDNSVHLVSSTSDNSTHFNLLMENLKEIEETFADSDSVRLERDILIQIQRLGALKLFHACLSRTLKAPDAIKVAFPLTKYAKDSPISRPMKSRMDNITVFSGKKSQRKSVIERAAEKVAKISDLQLHSKSVNLVQQLTKSSNPKSRRFTVARNEMEMAKGLKELTNLGRIHSTLEERIGRGASLTSWARAAGIDEKVLQQRLHFGWHCRDNLLKSARSLVLYIVRNYRRRGISLEDLLQAGNMGVLKGAERFDHTRGYRFSTYVQYWIRKSMSSLIAQHSKGIKIPVTLNDIIEQTKKARRSLYRSNGTFPRDEEIAKLAGVSVASVRLANKCSRAMGSIDQKIGDCMHVTFKEFTPDTTLKTPEEIVMKQHMQKEIQELLEHLHPRERQVLVLRFGLEDGNRRSLEEIGKLFHVSKEWIRKIEKAALTKVRNEELKTRLKHYVEY